MSNPENAVRFYYLDSKKEGSKILAWDDYEDLEADLHEDHLIKNDIPYRREQSKD